MTLITFNIVKDFKSIRDNLISGLERLNLISGEVISKTENLNSIIACAVIMIIILLAVLIYTIIYLLKMLLTKRYIVLHDFYSKEFVCKQIQIKYKNNSKKTCAGRFHKKEGPKRTKTVD